MSKTTRATLALGKLGVKFALHSYDYDPDADRIGLQAAEALGVEPRRVLKTLMAEVDGKPTSVYLNGGQRGLQIELDPKDGARALDAIVSALTS